VALLALLASSAAAQDPAALDAGLVKVALENQRVRVLRARYAPGQASAMHEHPARVVVLLTDAQAAQTRPDGTASTLRARAGAALWSDPTRHAVRNAGSQPMETIEIELKAVPGARTVWLRDARAADPGHLTLLFENNWVRVLRLRLGPGQSAPAYPLGRHLAVAVSNGRARLTAADGSSQEVTQAAGELAWSEPGAVAVANLGDGTYERISLELRTEPATAPAEEPGLKRAVAEETALAYLDRGSGPPVVLVHGAVADYRAWAAVAERLAGRRRVIVPSLRYHWPNTGGGDGSDYGPARHAADLAALLVGLELGPVRLVGHSLGGHVALLLARDHPELVQSLALVEPSVPSILYQQADGDTVRRAQARVLEVVRSLAGVNDQERAVRTLLGAAYGQGSLDRLPDWALAMYLDNGRAIRAWSDSTAPASEPACEGLRRIATPTLLLGGERSPESPGRILAELARCLPKAETVTLPGASHGMPMDAPDAVADALTRFWDAR
jgi:pimeloyl-ACP methyl ester carboxylesterase/quercetin dioxygenase-like cupin family protein